MRAFSMSRGAAGGWGIWRISWPVVGFEGTDGVPHSLLGVADGLGPQLLDSNEYPDTIPNFLDAHFLQDQLITLYEVAAGDVVDCVSVRRMP